MTFPTDDHVRHFLERARAAEARADAEAQRARRAEELAVAESRLGEIHRGVAELHRRTEQRHRTTARIQRCFAGQLDDRAEPVSLGRALAATVAEIFDAPSSAIVLDGDMGCPAVSQGADELAELAQDLEFVHAEGPHHLVAASGRSIHVTADRFEATWPHFGPAVTALGVRNVNAVPLPLGQRVIGALSFFNAPSSTTVEAPLDVVAAGVARVFLASTTDPGAPEAPSVVDGMRDIHQAAGMVAASAGCDLETALTLIRARAFADTRPAATVAQRVLSGELDLTS